MCIRDRSERVRGCKGVETNVYQLEREYEESIEVEGLQRVNFPQVYCEPRCSQMLLFKGKSPVLLEDMRSLSCSLKNYELVPSGWSERENVIGRWDERYLERELCVDREIELYQLKRNYK